MTENQAPPYRKPVADVLAAFHTDGRRGLTEAGARAQFQRYGRNELTAEKPVSAWRKFLAQFQSPLVMLLVVATAISLGLWLY